MKNASRRLRLLAAWLLLAAPALQAAEFGKSLPAGASLGTAGAPQISPAAGAPSALPSSFAIPSLTTPGATLPSAALPSAAPGARLPGAFAPQLPLAAIPDAARAMPQASAASPDDKKAPSARAQIEQAAASSGQDGGEGRVSSLIDGSRPAGSSAAEVAAPSVDVEREFHAAYPNDPGARYLAARGIPLSRFAADMVMGSVFMSTRDGEHPIDQLLPPGRGREYDDLAALTHKILDLAQRDDVAGRRFAAALGRDKAQADMPAALMGAGREKLPGNPLPSGQYWDLAAGPNALGHMVSSLSPNTKYVFLDRSTFVTSYLEAGRRIAAAKGRDMSAVEILNADLRGIQKPAAPISVLRWKNVHTYIQGFEKRMEEMAGWIAPGGRLVIQNDAGAGQRIGILTKLAPVIQDLIAKGYAFDYEPLGRGDLETLTLSKPAAGAAADANAVRARSLKRWAAYADEVHAVNQAERGGGDWLRRMLGGR
jgi:hypothetical protein